MRTLRKNFRQSTIALALSIAALPGLVNGQAQSLSTVNKAQSSNKSDLKDSANDNRAGLAKLIAIIIKSGTDGNIPSILAPIIGLPKAMPMRKQIVVISEHDKDFEQRSCFVVYENTENDSHGTDTKRAVCAYIVMIKRSGLDRQTRYFRIDLNGKLEKVVLSQGKYDDTGKVVRGSGIKTDQDIDSPEVRQTFEAEMKFWLKDWLKKEQKNAAKTADAAKPSSAAPAL